MPTGSLVLKDGEQKMYQNAQARIDTPTLLRMHRSENSRAAFHAEPYRYWESVEREEESNASVALSSVGWLDNA
jgi:hypothetical protein